jgi:hypothetical protein
MSIKILTSTKQELARLAFELPRLQRSNPDGSPMFKWRPVLGSQLLAEYAKATDNAGNPIAPKRRYWRNEPVLVDHYAEMKRALEHGGMNAVYNYHKDAKAIVDNATRKRHWLQVWWWKVLLRLNIFTETMRQQMETLRHINTKPTNITTKP